MDCRHFLSVTNGTPKVESPEILAYLLSKNFVSFWGERDSHKEFHVLRPVSTISSVNPRRVYYLIHWNRVFSFLHKGKVNGK